MIGGQHAGFSVIVQDDLAAGILEQRPNPRISTDRRTAVAIESPQTLLLGARAGFNTVSGVDLSAVQHPIQRLLLSEPFELDSSGRSAVQSHDGTVTELAGAAVVPGNLVSVYSGKLLYKRSHPQRRRHRVVGNTDALAPQIAKLANTRVAVGIKLQPQKRLGEKNRQPGPLPSRAASPFPGHQIFRDRHLGNIEFIVFQIAKKKFPGRTEDKLEIDIVRPNMT
ncbi:MAG: hypothetical protein ACREO5_06650 [Candidatus Binatia bacterium]